MARCRRPRFIFTICQMRRSDLNISLPLLRRVLEPLSYRIIFTLFGPVAIYFMYIKWISFSRRVWVTQIRISHSPGVRALLQYGRPTFKSLVYIREGGTWTGDFHISREFPKFWAKGYMGGILLLLSFHPTIWEYRWGNIYLLLLWGSCWGPGIK